MKPQFLIASLTPGAGKTTLSLGISRLLQQKGLRVQSYKCGSDLIDPQYLSMSTDKPVVNLDNWLSSPYYIQHLYNNYGENADLCIVEGSAALFDGYDGSKGSCSEIAMLLHLPVILVINARMAGYSVAAMILGFKLFNPKLKIAGVVFNQTISGAQYKYLYQACIDTGVECFGYIPYISDDKFISKHSAITVSARKDINSLIDKIADKIAQTVDVHKIIESCKLIFPCLYMLPYTSDYDDDIDVGVKKIRIAVAKDVAFNYMYWDNLMKLSKIGNITYFSPLYSNELPKCDMLYLPNGVPELFARQIYRRKKMLEDIRDFAEQGGMILAEGNSVSILASTLTIRENGTAYEMASIFPFDCDTIGLKLHSGYVNIISKDNIFRGNEFHYCNITGYSQGDSDIKMINSKGMEISDNIFRYKNSIASLANIYWGENDILSLWNTEN